MIIIDTHIWVWWVHGDSRLTEGQFEIRRLEGWKIRRLEGWKIRRLEGWERGKKTGYSAFQGFGCLQAGV